MLRTLLADRFAVRFHRERKESVVYVLVPMKNRKPAPGLSEVPPGSCVDLCNGIHIGSSQINAVDISLPSLAETLAQVTGRPVIDHTALPGGYNVSLQWEDSDIFTAIQEQLGLKLEARKEPVEILVIDHAGKPPEN